MIELAAPLHARPATADDQPFLDALYRSVRVDLLQAAPNEAVLAQLLQMQRQAETMGMRHAYPEAQSLVLERHGIPVGRMIVEAARQRLHLLDLTLLPQARGQGHGSTLLDALKAAATLRGEPLTLNVAIDNLGAQRLYSRHGFSTVGDAGFQYQMQWASPVPRLPAANHPRLLQQLRKPERPAK